MQMVMEFSTSRICCLPQVWGGEVVVLALILRKTKKSRAIQLRVPQSGHLLLGWRNTQHPRWRLIGLSCVRPHRPIGSSSRKLYLRVSAPQEMWHVAVQTGFDAGEDAWAGEFAALCRDHKRDPIRGGIDPALFAKLVDDKSDLGIYCTDQQLTEMLNSAPPSRPIPRPTPAQLNVTPEPPAHVQAGKELLGSLNVTSEPPAGTSWRAANELVRSELIKAAFQALNWTGTGHLSADEMRPFANQTGFDGTDEDWKKEFEMLLQESGDHAGITLPNFLKLANDDSDDGCYCSNDELESLIANLEELRKVRVAFVCDVWFKTWRAAGEVNSWKTVSLWGWWTFKSMFLRMSWSINSQISIMNQDQVVRFLSACCPASVWTSLNRCNYCFALVTLGITWDYHGLPFALMIPDGFWRVWTIPHWTPFLRSEDPTFGLPEQQRNHEKPLAPGQRPCGQPTNATASLGFPRAEPQQESRLCILSQLSWSCIS